MCTHFRVYNNQDQSSCLVCVHIQMHLFDIDVKGGVCFKESDVLSAGSAFATITVDNFKIGLGICYDIRFEEHARVYRNMGKLYWKYFIRVLIDRLPKH